MNTVGRKVVISRLDNKSLLNRIIVRRPSHVVKTIDNQQKLRSLYREDVIYESKKGDFLDGESFSILLVNRLYCDTNHCETIAWYKPKVLGIKSVLDKTEQRTSEQVTKLIGKDNYDTIFSALCSVINTELKIRAILALLLKPKEKKTSVTQTESSEYKTSPLKLFKEVSCQTDVSEIFNKYKKKRVRRQPKVPYVVRDMFFNDIKNNVDSSEVFVHVKAETSPVKSNIEFVKNEDNLKTENHFEQVIKIEHLNLEQEIDVSEQVKELKANPENNSTLDKCELLNEDSNISGFSRISLDSLPISINEAILDTLVQEEAFSDFEFEKSMPNKGEVLQVFDGSEIQLPFKPRSMFHIAIPSIMRNKTPEEQNQIVKYQAYIDWKMCMTEIDGSNLPIHMAVLENDVMFLKRHCIWLSKKGSVDVPTKDGNLTPLQLALIKDSSPECTKLLLQYGSNPLLVDEESRTAFHLAAEASSGHLEALLAYCKEYPRKMIENNPSLLKLVIGSPSNEQLSQRLFFHISTICDESGRTPLILACRRGKHENVKLLAGMCPENVDHPMSNCGNTALFEAVGAACVHTQASSNRSKVDENFKKTIQILLQHGADPSKDNDSGVNVNTLLSDYNINELSMLIANKTQDSIHTSLDKLILYKGNKKSKTTSKSKPVILQNLPITKHTITSQNSTIVSTTVAKPAEAKKVVKPIVLKTFPVVSKINVNGKPIFVHNITASNSKLPAMSLNTSKATTFKPNVIIRNISDIATQRNPTMGVVPISHAGMPTSSEISTKIVDKPGNIVITNASKRKNKEVTERKKKTRKSSG